MKPYRVASRETGICPPHALLNSQNCCSANAASNVLALNNLSARAVKAHQAPARRAENLNEIISLSLRIKLETH